MCRTRSEPDSSLELAPIARAEVSSAAAITVNRDKRQETRSWPCAKSPTRPSGPDDLRERMTKARQTQIEVDEPEDERPWPLLMGAAAPKPTSPRTDMPDGEQLLLARGMAAQSPVSGEAGWPCGSYQRR